MDDEGRKGGEQKKQSSHDFNRGDAKLRKSSAVRSCKRQGKVCPAVDQTKKYKQHKTHIFF